MIDDDEFLTVSREEFLTLEKQVYELQAQVLQISKKLDESMGLFIKNCRQFDDVVNSQKKVVEIVSQFLTEPKKNLFQRIFGL